MRYWQLQEFTTVLNIAVKENIALREQVIKNNHFILEEDAKIWRAESLSSAKQRKLKNLEIDKLSLLHKLCNLLCHSLNIDLLQNSEKVREKLRLELINFVNLKTADEPFVIPQEILKALQEQAPQDFMEAKNLIAQVNSNSKKINKLLSVPLEANRYYYSLEESAMVYFNTHLKVTPNNAEVKGKMTDHFVEKFLKDNSLTYKPLYINQKTLEAYIANLPDPFTGRAKTEKPSFTRQQNGFFLSQRSSRSSLGHSIVHTITHSPLGTHSEKKSRVPKKSA